MIVKNKIWVYKIDYFWARKLGLSELKDDEFEGKAVFIKFKMQKLQKTVSKIDRKLEEILGVKIDSTSTQRVLNQVETAITQTKKKGQFEPKMFIVTPNPEQIMLAQKDAKFKSILNKADCAVPDGIGLAAAKKFLDLFNPKYKILRHKFLFGQGMVVGAAIILNRKWLEKDFMVIKGRDLFLDLIDLADKKKWRVVLIGNGDKSAQKAADKLRPDYKSAQLHTFAGPVLDDNGKPVSSEDLKKEKKIIKEINKIKPRLLFVGFGAPKQEKWVYRWLPKMNIGCVMVVGGTFDFVSGTTKLPPKFMENLGLEWLWRLITQPKRIGRIFTAAVVFPSKVFLYKFSKRTGD